MRRIKKTLCILICLVMVCSLLPVTGHAELKDYFPGVIQEGTCTGPMAGRYGGKHYYVLDERGSRSPTCTEVGTGYYQCAGGCGDRISREVPALGHDWDDWIRRTEPTCTNGTTEQRWCGRCGQIESRDVPALGHDYSSRETKAATCTESGTMEYTCTRCGDAKTETIAALGHAWDEGVTVEPQGLTDGSFTKTCYRCGESETETLPVSTTALFSSLRNIPPNAQADGELVVVVQPDGGSLFEGEYTLTVMVEGGTEPYRYEWYKVNGYAEKLTDKLTHTLGRDAAGGSVEDMDGGVDLGTAYSRTTGVATNAGSFVMATLDDAFADHVNTATSTASSFQPVDEDYLLNMQESFIAPDLSSGCVDISESPKYTATSEGYYYCRIFDAIGRHVDSDTAYVSTPVYIAVQPNNVNLRSSDTSALYCRAAGGTPYDGDSPYMYFWYKDGEELSKGFQSAITVTEPGEYYCVAEDFTTMSATSKTVTAYEAEPLWLEADQALFEGTAGEKTQISFSVGGGVGPYTFYWHQNGVGFKLPEYNKDTTGTETLMVEDPGEYGLRVTDSMGETLYRTTIVLYEPLVIIEQPQGGMVLRDDDAPPVKLSIRIEAPDKSPPRNYFYYELYKDGMSDADAICLDGWTRTYYDYYVDEPGEYRIKVFTLDGRYAWSDTVTVTSNFNDPLIVEQPESVYVYPESKGEQTQYSATYTCRAISPDTGDDRYLEYYWEVSLRDTWTGEAKEWLRRPDSQNYFSGVTIVGNEVRPLYCRCVVVDTRTGNETVSNVASTVYKLAYIGVESHKPVRYYQEFYQERVRFFGGMWPCTGIAYAFQHDFNGNALIIPYCSNPKFHYDSDGSFFMKFDNFDMQELCAKVYGDGDVMLVSQPTDFCAVVTDASGNTCCSDIFNFTVTTDSYSDWDIDDLQYELLAD